MTNLKSILGICLIMCLSMSVLGQTEKGKSLIGADTKFNLNIEPETDRTTFELGLQLGGFIKDNLAIGAEGVISTAKRKEDDEKIGSEIYAIAPFVRYYLGKNKIKPFLHSSIGVGTTKSNYKGYSGIVESKSSLLLYELGGGVAFFLNDKISVNLNLGYSDILMKEENADKYSTKVSGIGSTIGFVFTF